METIYRDTIDLETIARHQACAARFFHHAQTNIAEGNIERAIQALARCISHSTTALAENRPIWHNSRRQMERVLVRYASNGTLSRSHIITFREIYNSPHLPKSKHHTSQGQTTHIDTTQIQPTHRNSDANTRHQNATHSQPTRHNSDANTRRQNATRINTTHSQPGRQNSDVNTRHQNATHINTTNGQPTHRHNNSDGNTHRRQNATNGQPNHRNGGANSHGNTRRRQNATHIDATQATSDGQTHRRQNATHIDTTNGQPTSRSAGQRRNAFTSLRRLRRRVAAFLKAANAILAGKPLPVRETRRYLRKPHELMPPTFYSVQDITDLPNYNQIRSRFRLPNELAAKTDPHDHYGFRQEPVACYCHPKPRKITTNSAFITLSPLWRRALEKTFHIKLPTPLPLRI